MTKVGILVWVRVSHAASSLGAPPFSPYTRTLSRQYHMADLDRIGGIPVSLQSSAMSCNVHMYMYVRLYIFYMQVVMKELMTGGLINGDCLTITGDTVSGNLVSVPRVADLDKQAGLIPILHGMGTHFSRVVFPPQDVLFPLNEPLAPAGHHMIIVQVCGW